MYLGISYTILILSLVVLSSLFLFARFFYLALTFLTPDVLFAHLVIWNILYIVVGYSPVRGILENNATGWDRFTKASVQIGLLMAVAFANFFMLEIVACFAD